MSGCEDLREKLFLFKLRQSSKCETFDKRAPEGKSLTGSRLAGGGQGCERTLQLQGWSKSRRVIILRRQERQGWEKGGQTGDCLRLVELTSRTICFSRK